MPVVGNNLILTPICIIACNIIKLAEPTKINLIVLLGSLSTFFKIENEKDVKIKLILIGSISLILLQTFIHIGVNIRILPTTGMTLPFLSYGGSSIISTAILSGIILNFTKRRVK